MTDDTKKKQPRIGTLKTALDCRRELAKAYRQYRTGLIDDKTARTSTSMLTALVSIIRDHDFEDRLTRLEDTL